MRMNIRVKSAGKKKAVNLSIDSELLKAAREQGLNLSKVLERALTEERARRWLAENKEAIEAYNEDIRKHGVWSDGLRPW
jgi:antitoxin CcdA